MLRPAYHSVPSLPARPALPAVRRRFPLLATPRGRRGGAGDRGCGLNRAGLDDAGTSPPTIDAITIVTGDGGHGGSGVDGSGGAIIVGG